MSADIRCPCRVSSAARWRVDFVVHRGAFRPGRQHDQTALKTEGIGDLLQRYPQVQALVDAGYRGLARQFPDQVTAPPLPPAKDAPPDEAARWQTSRKD